MPMWDSLIGQPDELDDSPAFPRKALKVKIRAEVKTT
jgi:hypothetical protein